MNKEVAKEIDLSPKDIEELAKEFEGLNENTFGRVGMPAELVLLKGRKGEIARIRADFDYAEGRKHTMIIEYPLSLKIEDQKYWIKHALKFFKPLFIVRFEAISLEEELQNITRRPYIEGEYEEFDPSVPQRKTKRKARVRTYAHGAPYGSLTHRLEIISHRNNWIRKTHEKLKRMGVKELNDLIPRGQEGDIYRNPGIGKSEKILYIIKHQLKKYNVPGPWKGNEPKKLREIGDERITKIMYGGKSTSK